MLRRSVPDAGSRIKVGQQRGFCRCQLEFAASSLARSDTRLRQRIDSFGKRLLPGDVRLFRDQAIRQIQEIGQRYAEATSIWTFASLMPFLVVMTFTGCVCNVDFGGKFTV